jgi:hypothetical protein
MACCAVVAIFLASGLAFADDTDFTIGNVHVDVTAASALAAKDQAQTEGQAQAFETLMTRLGVGKPHLTPAQVTDMVVGFEVANERTSTVRYVADLTYHFNPAAVRRMLASPDIMATAAPVKRGLVVLPVLIGSDGRAELWDDPNPWRDAWIGNAGKQGLIKIVVPEGDLPDVAAIDAPKAVAGDRAALKAISARYNNGDVLVVQGKFGPPGQFDMQAVRYSADNPAPGPTVQLMTTAKPGENETQQLARSVGYVAWKVSQLPASASPAPATASAGPATPTTNSPSGGGNGGTVAATLASGSLGDWVMVRKRLSGIPAVSDAALVSFDRGSMHIAIRYTGARDQLRSALDAHGLELAGGEPNWTLTIRAQPLTAKLPTPAPDASPSPPAATPTATPTAPARAAAPPTVAPASAEPDE